MEIKEPTGNYPPILMVTEKKKKAQAYLCRPNMNSVNEVFKARSHL